ncbi:MAG: CDP-alcohol phosphatidyltransferase family protein [Pseudomonadota bacterium]
MLREAIIYVPTSTPEAMSVAVKKVAGVPLIVRGIMTLASQGFESITLLIPQSHQPSIERFLKRYREKRVPKIHYSQYGEPYCVTTDNINDLTSNSNGDVLLINSNILFDPKMVAKISARKDFQDEVVGIKSPIKPQPILRINRKSFEKLLEFVTQKPRGIESCIEYLTKEMTSFVRISEDLQPFLITGNSDVLEAQNYLTEKIRLATSGPIAKYINKKISLPVSLVLSKLWISPHAITVVNIVIGVFSGVFIADGSHYWMILFGAFLYQLASITDGCDGEVAKLTFRASKFGQYLDSISDNLTLGSMMTGLIAGYWRQTHSPIAFYLGGMMVISAFAIFFFMIRFLKCHTNSASLVTYDKEFIERLSKKYNPILLRVVHYSKFLLKKDMMSFIIFVLAVFGLLYYWLYVCAFGGAASALMICYLDHSERVAPSRQTDERTLST